MVEIPKTPTFPLAQAIRAASALPPVQSTRIATLDVFAYQMYWRCVRLAKSSEILLLSHQAEEALILARSLFEDSLRLRTYP